MKKENLDNHALAMKKAHRNRVIKNNIVLYAMLFLPLFFIFIFSYKPMYGVLIAFQDYLPGRDIIGPTAKWVGLKHIKKFVNSYYFVRLIRNTLRLSIMNLFFGFWVPIVFALLLNEVYYDKAKKWIQTISYMPHFISSVVIAGMVLSFIASDGIIVKALNALGGEFGALNTSQPAFPWIYTLTKVWQGFGWSSILYLSTMSSIDPGLYEAAEIDGAKRIQRIWYITLPELKGIIVIQLIFAIGGLMGSDSDLILLLYNSSIYEVADVVGTYVYREGLNGAQFSYGSAVGLFMTVFNFILVFITNKVSDKVANYSLW